MFLWRNKKYIYLIPPHHPLPAPLAQPLLSRTQILDPSQWEIAAVFLLSPLTGKVQGRSNTNQVLLIGILCFYHRSSVELNKFLTLHFSLPHGRLINIIYFIAQKIFLLNILEAVLAYDLVKIRFIKEKEAILNGNTNDKSRGIQLIGPGYLQKVIKGVNWLLSPIARVSMSEYFE